MNSYQTSWEDEENNRVVDFRVDYELIDEMVRIDSITPLQVAFLCRESTELDRQVGVHTEKGRAVLVRQFLACGQMPALEKTLSVHASVARVASPAGGHVLQSRSLPSPSVI